MSSLGVPGEHVHPLPPLATDEAVQLFVVRAADHAARAAVEAVDEAKLVALCERLDRRAAGLILVQGDTSSAYAGALAARDQDIALGHVEAGLRSHDLGQPWPACFNRSVTGDPLPKPFTRGIGVHSYSRLTFAVVLFAGAVLIL